MNSVKLCSVINIFCKFLKERKVLINHKYLFRVPEPLKKIPRNPRGIPGRTNSSPRSPGRTNLPGIPNPNLHSPQVAVCRLQNTDRYLQTSIP